MARTRADVISEMVDSGLFSDDEIRNAVKTSAHSQDATAGDGKGFIRRAAESVVGSSALPIAGGVAGGILGTVGGTVAGLGIGGVPGGAAGAAVGGAGGEAVKQIASRALGMDAPLSPGQAAKDIGVEGLTQGVGALAGSGIGAAGKVAGKAIAGPAGDLFQIITKIKPKDAATLFKNPKSILPGQWTKAQAAWRKAAQEAGLPIDDVSPEIINALKKDARSTVFDAFEKIQGKGAVSAAEAQTAKQALDIALMPAAKTERNKPLVALYSKMRSEFTKRISEESQELAAANTQYGIARSGKRFRSLFPRNLDDSPAYFRSSVLPSILFGLGAGRGDPGSGAATAAGAAALTSPLAIGALIAAAGGARNLSAGVPLGRTAVAALADLAKEKFGGR